MAIMASRILERFILLPYRPDQGAALRAAGDEMAHDLARLVEGVAVPPEVAGLMARLLDSDRAVVTGNWAETRQAAMVVLERGLSSLFLRQVGASHAAIARRQGDLEVAWRLVRLALPDGAEYQPGNQALHIALPLQQLAPALALDAGDLPTTRSWLEAYDRWLEWSGAVLGRAEGALGWAQYHHASGDLLIARERAEQALGHASDPRQPLALIAVHRLLGQLDADEQDFDAAEEHLQESLRLAEACAAPFERALTLLVTVKLRMAQARGAEARSSLGEVRAICEPLAAKPTLETVAALELQLSDLPV
jgi:tetratricopeptide (TPR) repeat protein